MKVSKVVFDKMGGQVYDPCVDSVSLRKKSTEKKKKMPTLVTAYISKVKCSSKENVQDLRVRAKLVGWKDEKSKFTDQNVSPR